MDYITLISRASDRYGNLLLEMMDKLGVRCLAEVTPKQAEAFYIESVQGGALRAEKGVEPTSGRC